MDRNRHVAAVTFDGRQPNVADLLQRKIHSEAEQKGKGISPLLTRGEQLKHFICDTADLLSGEHIEPYVLICV